VGRPKEHDDRTRVLLLDTAEELIAAHGPQALSVRGLADTAGTTTRAVYSLFGSKSGLLSALATRLFESLAAAIDATPRTDDPAADIVAASLDGFRRTALEHPSLYRLVFLQVVPDLELGQEFDAAAGAAFGMLEDLLRRLDARSGIAGHSPRQAARAVHALTEGLATLELRGGLPHDDAEATWRAALEAILRGLTVAGPARA
jgi:AcrR family transcriptional regulator